ncbi:Atu4866 domain-containing protein [Nonomuraea candida]|uniref:Atu4866 domain-containing protein n=1 Tax=Nonomuraea candida TaxID=359159 RepID=UPI0009FDB61D|nr:Atu4866 domain-containing protein [Nonomuraea candida]
MFSKVLLTLGLVTTLAACADGRGPAAGQAQAARGAASAGPHPYVGMWVTADGRIRQELLPDGRYEEARDGRERAYTGRYTVTGSHIDYVDDTGFTATGDVRGGVLYHEHLVLYREQR